MKLYNKTNQIQEILVIDRNNNSLTYSIYITAKNELEIEKDLVITNLNELINKGVIAVLGSHKEVEKVEIVKIEPKIINNEIEDENIENEIEEVDTPSVETDIDKFICPTCGKEYASERSLNMHISRAHKE